MPEPIYWRTDSGFIKGDAFYGNEAIRRARELVNERPTCAGLVDAVGRFYRGDFVLSTYPIAEESRFSPYTGEMSDKVHIRLGLNSDRVPESLAHELLHGDFLRRGYPWFDVEDPGHYAALNYVHHELMLPLWNELGLDRGKLFGPPSILGNAEVEALLENDRADFCFWCRQWCG